MDLDLSICSQQQQQHEHVHEHVLGNLGWESFGALNLSLVVSTASLLVLFVSFVCLFVCL